MATNAVARETIASLRRTIARIEGTFAERLEAPAATRDSETDFLVRRNGRAGEDAFLPTGVERLDTVLGGGVPRAGLTEIHSAAVRDAGAAAGFALSLSTLLQAGRPAAPLLWIGMSDVFREAGRPYGPGLAARFGLSPENLLVAEADRLADVLWIAEEAAALDLFLMVLLEIRGSHKRLDLVATRRLHRRALAARHPLLLIREAGEPEPTAAPLRLVIASAPASPRRLLSGPLAGSIGPPAFHVTVSKSRTAIPTTFILEWNDDAFQERRRPVAKDHGAVVPLPAGRKGAAAALRTVVAFPYAEGDAAAGVEPPRGQHPAHRRAGRAG